MNPLVLLAIAGLFALAKAKSNRAPAPSEALPPGPWPLQDWPYLFSVAGLRAPFAGRTDSRGVPLPLDLNTWSVLLTFPWSPWDVRVGDDHMVTDPRAIEIMQRQLVALGMLHEPFTVGSFDAATRAGVRLAALVPFLILEGSELFPALSNDPRATTERANVESLFTRSTPTSVGFFFLAVVDALYQQRILHRRFNDDSNAAL